MLPWKFVCTDKRSGKKTLWKTPQTTWLATAIKDNLSSSQKKFIAEVIGTFVVVVLATGSVVIDAKMGGVLGLPSIAFAPFVGLAIGVYFVWQSLHGLSPRHDFGFPDYKPHNEKAAVALNACRDNGGAIGNLVCRACHRGEAFLGTISPDYAYPLPLIFGAKMLASALLIAVILVVVLTRGLIGFGGIVIGAVAGLDKLFLAYVSWSIDETFPFIGPCLTCLIIRGEWRKTCGRIEPPPLLGHHHRDNLWKKFRDWLIWRIVKKYVFSTKNNIKKSM
jgi:aquaporin Z